MAGAPLMVVATKLTHSYIAETIRETAPSFGLSEPDNVVGFADR